MKKSDFEKSRDGILGHQFDKQTRVVCSMLFSLFWRILQKTNTLLWLLKSIQKISETRKLQSLYGMEFDTTDKRE
jgi:hypothetical protein